MNKPYSIKSSLEGILDFIAGCCCFFINTYLYRLHSLILIIDNLHIFFSPYNFTIFIFCSSNYFVPACCKRWMLNIDCCIAGICSFQYFFTYRIVFYFIFIFVHIQRKVAVKFLLTHYKLIGCFPISFPKNFIGID